MRVRCELTEYSVRALHVFDLLSETLIVPVLYVTAITSNDAPVVSIDDDVAPFTPAAVTFETRAMVMV